MAKFLWQWNIAKLFYFSEGHNDGNVRLVGGTTSQEGRVEIWYNSQWNAVCDDLWDVNDAHVVCRQLGYRGAVAAHQSAHFGQGSGQILLDDLRCTGREASLLECSHNGINEHNCGKDSSVTCECYLCWDAYSHLHSHKDISMLLLSIRTIHVQFYRYHIKFCKWRCTADKWLCTFSG